MQLAVRTPFNLQSLPELKSKPPPVSEHQLKILNNLHFSSTQKLLIIINSAACQTEGYAVVDSQANSYRNQAGVCLSQATVVAFTLHSEN